MSAAGRDQVPRPERPQQPAWLEDGGSYEVEMGQIFDVEEL